MTSFGVAVFTMPLCRSEKGQPYIAIPEEMAADAEFARWHVLRAFEMMREKEHGSKFQLPSIDPDDWRLVHQGDSRYTIEPA